MGSLHNLDKGQADNSDTLRKKVPTSQLKLKELITCSVCLELLNDPKMLPCQHTFCKNCVQKCGHQGTQKEGLGVSKVKCAQCRAETQLPRGGVAALPANIYVQSLIDIIKAGDVHCYMCDTSCELRKCEHCCHSFCIICEQRHLAELREQLRAIVEQLEAAKIGLIRRSKTYLISCDRLKEALHLEVQRRVKEVLDTESRLAGRIDEACGRMQAACAEAARKLEASESAVVGLLESEIEVTFNNREKVAKFMEIHKETSETLTAVDRTTFENLTFNPEKMTVTDCTETTGQPLDSGSEERKASGTAPVTSSLDNSQQRTKKSKRHEEENSQSLVYRCKSFVSRACTGSSFLQRPTGVAVSPWSKEVYVVSMDTHKVCVFDISRGKFLRSFGSRGENPGEFVCPYGIALSLTNQEVMVSDKQKHCVHVFGRDGRFSRQLGSKGRGPAQFRGPEAICVDRRGNVYVCDVMNNRVQILDKEGVFLRQIDGQVAPPGGTTRSRSPLFQEPAGIAVGRDGQVVICDPANHRIHVFNHEGVPLFTCGQKGSLRGQFNRPECVAVDDQGFLLVGDSGNCRIQVLRPDGRFVRAFGSKGSSAGNFSWISGLAVADGNMIVVCDYKNHSLQIF